MVKRFNRLLLQLLRCYVDTEDDWERYLPLVLYAYRTAQHWCITISTYVWEITTISSISATHCF